MAMAFSAVSSFKIHDMMSTFLGATPRMCVRSTKQTQATTGGPSISLALGLPPKVVPVYPSSMRLPLSSMAVEMVLFLLGHPSKAV